MKNYVQILERTEKLHRMTRGMIKLVVMNDIEKQQLERATTAVNRLIDVMKVEAAKLEEGDLPSNMAAVEWVLDSYERIIKHFLQNSKVKEPL